MEHTPPAGTFADLRSSDLEEEEQEEAEEEEVRTLDSEEVKQPGVRVVTVLKGPWWGCRFGLWSTVGVGAAWSNSLWSDEVLLLLLIELGLPLKEIQGWVVVSW